MFILLRNIVKNSSYGGQVGLVYINIQDDLSFDVNSFHINKSQMNGMM